MYEATRLNVLDSLCRDIIVSLDFQGQHQRLVLDCNGNSPELVMSDESNYALAVADTKKTSLFSNLTPGVKPIATKSRRFNETDRAFIQKTVNKWLKEGIIQASAGSGG